MKTPELLAPAGTLKKLRYALAYGADAVYAGMPRYSLRVRENDFARLPQLAEGIAETRRQGRRFYLACNVLPHNTKVHTFLDDIAPVVELGPDALIMADPGLIMLVRERWPELPVHLSVQANTVNFASVKFWQSLGLSRIILSRELSLDEVAEIRQQCPDMELEVFVHGALCIAYSGRCLLSGYFNHRDANQGTCTNSCRWKYDLHDGETDAAGDVRPAALGSGARHPAAERVYFVEEEKRPGELMPIEEDEHGTYIMNSRDLRAVHHVARLVEMGIDSLKIEGRTKSHYYVARVTQVYRRAIDAAVRGEPFDPRLMDALEALSHRGYTDGFFDRHPAHAYQNYTTNSTDGTQRFVGEITGYDVEHGLARVAVKNRFAVGDRLEFISPRGNRVFRLGALYDEQGRPMDVVPGGGYVVQIPLPAGVDAMADAAMGLLARLEGAGAGAAGQTPPEVPLSRAGSAD